MALQPGQIPCVKACGDPANTAHEGAGPLQLCLACYWVDWPRSATVATASASDTFPAPAPASNPAPPTASHSPTTPAMDSNGPTSGHVRIPAQAPQGVRPAAASNPTYPNFEPPVGPNQPYPPQWYGAPGIGLFPVGSPQEPWEQPYFAGRPPQMQLSRAGSAPNLQYGQLPTPAPGPFNRQASPALEPGRESVIQSLAQDLVRRTSIGSDSGRSVTSASSATLAPVSAGTDTTAVSIAQTTQTAPAAGATSRPPTAQQQQHQQHQQQQQQIQLINLFRKGELVGFLQQRVQSGAMTQAQADQMFATARVLSELQASVQAQRQIQAPQAPLNQTQTQARPPLTANAAQASALASMQMAANAGRPLGLVQSRPGPFSPTTLQSMQQFAALARPPTLLARPPPLSSSGGPPSPAAQERLDQVTIARELFSQPEHLARRLEELAGGTPLGPLIDQLIFGYESRYGPFRRTPSQTPANHFVPGNANTAGSARRGRPPSQQRSTTGPSNRGGRGGSQNGIASTTIGASPADAVGPAEQISPHLGGRGNGRGRGAAQSARPASLAAPAMLASLLAQQQQQRQAARNAPTAQPPAELSLPLRAVAAPATAVQPSAVEPALGGPASVPAPIPGPVIPVPPETGVRPGAYFNVGPRPPPIVTHPTPTPTPPQLPLRSPTLRQQQLSAAPSKSAPPVNEAALASPAKSAEFAPASPDVDSLTGSKAKPKPTKDVLDSDSESEDDGPGMAAPLTVSHAFGPLAQPPVTSAPTSASTSAGFVAPAPPSRSAAREPAHEIEERTESTQRAVESMMELFVPRVDTTSPEEMVEWGEEQRQESQEREVPVAGPLEPEPTKEPEPAPSAPEEDVFDTYLDFNSPASGPDPPEPGKSEPMELEDVSPILVAHEDDLPHAVPEETPTARTDPEPEAKTQEDAARAGDKADKERQDTAPMEVDGPDDEVPETPTAEGTPAPLLPRDIREVLLDKVMANTKMHRTTKEFSVEVLERALTTRFDGDAQRAEQIAEKLEDEGLLDPISNEMHGTEVITLDNPDDRREFLRRTMEKFAAEWDLAAYYPQAQAGPSTADPPRRERAPTPVRDNLEPNESRCTHNSDGENDSQQEPNVGSQEDRGRTLNPLKRKSLYDDPKGKGKHKEPNRSRSPDKKRRA